MKILFCIFISMFCTITYSKCIECGTWVSNHFDGSYLMLEITEGENKNLNINIYIFSGGAIPNQWESTLILKAIRHRALYQDESTECKLVFVFYGKKIIVRHLNKTTFSCGFATGVTADGIYIKQN